jgi:hypothetical protein
VTKAAGRLFPFSVLAGACTVLVYVATLISRESIDLVEPNGLLPRWDLAAHLINGWADYYYLKTLQIPRLLWDIWSQGYWPPMQSLYQVPFYFLFGGDMAAGLRSSLGAFVMVGAVGAAVMYTQWRRTAPLPVAFFLLFLTTSPFALAYASVAMTEMLGILAHACVLLCYLRYEQSRTHSSARLFAISLTILFFTRYNYFVLLVLPLLLHEYLTRTSGWSLTDRARRAWRYAHGGLASPLALFVAVYVGCVFAVTLSGGFELSAFGIRISVRTIGNSGQPVLYLLLGRLAYLHWRGRIDWRRLTAHDPRIRPLLVWFALPVAVWLASPYPNHIKDTANLVINAPMGESPLAMIETVRRAYFHTDWLMALCAAGFVVAAARYRAQPPLMQWLVLAGALELVMVIAHHTRFQRFLMLPMLPLWLAAAGEIGSSAARLLRQPVLAGLTAAAIAVYGAASAHEIVRSNVFQRVAFENYLRSEALTAAFQSLRDSVGRDDQVAVQGRSETLSPALFKWQLGPPAGFPKFPVEVGADDPMRLDAATRVVLIVPTESTLATAEISSRYAAHASMLQERVDRSELVLERELPVHDQHVAFRLYRRVAPPP